MAESTTDEKVVTVITDTGNNGKDGTDDHSTSDDKNKSVPLATFLEVKNKAKQLEAEFKTMKDEQKAREDAKLLEDGKLNELITAKEQELATTKAELETSKLEAEDAKTFRKNKLAEYKTKFGDKWNDEYEKLSLTTLDKMQSSMLAHKDINVDKGATGEQADIKLTDEQKREAKAMYPYIKEEKAFEYHKHNLIKSGKIKPKEK